MSARAVFALGVLGAAAAAYAYKPARRVVFARHDPATELGLGLGAVAVLMGGYQIAAGIDAKADAPPPSATPVLPNVAPQPLAQPVQLTGSPISLETGGMYAGAVSLSFPLSTLATVAKVKAYAEGLGFSNVVVWEDTPPGWPGPLPDADYFVIGMYSGAPRTMDRPSQLVDAWRT